MKKILLLLTLISTNMSFCSEAHRSVDIYKGFQKEETFLNPETNTSYDIYKKNNTFVITKKDDCLYHKPLFRITSEGLTTSNNGRQIKATMSFYDEEDRYYNEIWTVEVGSWKRLFTR